MHLERRLLEAFDELWDGFVDPADALYDVDGTRWNALGGAMAPGVGFGNPLYRRTATGRNPRAMPGPGGGQ